jgi:predicted ArsR family transcriptional regulator
LPWNAKRFRECLGAYASETDVARLFETCNREKLSDSAKKAVLVKCLMDNFEKQFPETVRVKTMEECGRRCMGASIIERAKRIKKASKTLQELVDGLNKSRIGGGNLRLEDNKIHASYGRCYCGAVNKTKEKFSPTYCNCSRGWLLELFQQILEKPVKVEMQKTIIQGAKTCKFTIHT